MISMIKASEQLLMGAMDDRLCHLYGTDEAGVSVYKDRFLNILKGFAREFGDDRDVILVSAPGRTELGGNHTDHQRGNVLAGSVNLDVIACARPNGTSIVRAISEGYPICEVDISVLEPQPEEVNSTPSLIRGIAAAMDKRGYKTGGFDAYMTSSVLGGSGLSSSAAYEICVGTIMNHLFCKDALDAVELAKIGQFAENVYFGKPCGLLDQMAASVGGIVGIDFADLDNPVISQVDFDMTKSGYSLCIIDTGGDHKDLTDAYAAIPAEMCAIAKALGKDVLREVDPKDFMAALPALRKSCGDRAVLRALHFFGESDRAVDELNAVKAGDFDGFLELVKDSGRSSALYLQNVYAGISSSQQEILVALALAEKLLGKKGAVRVHGGGFAGTIQAFVPDDQTPAFKAAMEEVFGKDTCHVLKIRPAGGVVLMA